MCEIKKIKAAEMFGVVKELLSQGTKAWITVTGMSMYPFLREDRDRVELAQGSFGSIKKGDIVLIKRVSGEYVLHRVLRKEKEVFYMIGDAQKWIEGPLLPEQLIAVVTSIKRGKHEISCNNLWWKALTGFWLRIIPFRHIALRGIHRLTGIRRIVRKPA